MGRRSHKSAKTRKSGEEYLVVYSIFSLLLFNVYTGMAEGMVVYEEGWKVCRCMVCTNGSE